MDEPHNDLAARVGDVLGAAPVGWRRPPGGYTAAERWIVTLENGSSAFVKLATAEDSACWLRAEWEIYSQVSASFLPAVLGWEDAEFPLLILEDLSDAHWPPPWKPGMVDAVLRTLEEVNATPPPPGLPPVRKRLRSGRGWWEVVAETPGPFLSTGFCSAPWLDQALPLLIDAERAAPLAGNALLHCDVRSDNLCLRGDRVMLVDWNWACVGNPKIDIAAWLPSLHNEGGPRPIELMPDEPGLTAWLSGLWAANAGLPDPFPGSSVRDIQKRHLSVALPWVAEALGLPPPEPVSDAAVLTDFEQQIIEA